jgi:hypothetical protein
VTVSVVAQRSIPLMVIPCHVDQFLGGSRNVSVQLHTPLFLV